MLVIFLVAEFIIFPALTAADTIANLLGALIGVFTLAYLYYFLGLDKYTTKKSPKSKTNKNK